MRSFDSVHVNNVVSNPGPQHVSQVLGVVLDRLNVVASRMEQIAIKVDQLEARSSSATFTPAAGLASSNVKMNEVREKNPSHLVSQERSTLLESYGSGAPLARDASEVIFAFGDSVPRCDDGGRLRSSIAELLSLRPPAAPGTEPNPPHDWSPPLVRANDPSCLAAAPSGGQPLPSASAKQGGTLPLQSPVVGHGPVGTLPPVGPPPASRGPGPSPPSSTSSSSWDGSDWSDSPPRSREHVMDSILSEPSWRPPTRPKTAVPTWASVAGSAAQPPPPPRSSVSATAPVFTPQPPVTALTSVPHAGQLLSTAAVRGQVEQQPPPTSVPPSLDTNPSSASIFTWGECRVQFAFGKNMLKPDKMVGLEAMRIKNYDGFTGEGTQQLADLALLLQTLQDEVERGMWSEDATSAILRANVTRTARTLIKGVHQWRDILQALFRAFATERALAACQQDLRAPRMRPGENAHTFVARAVRLFELFGQGISDKERARVIMDELMRHESSYPHFAQPLLLQLRIVAGGIEANKMEILQAMLRENAAIAVVMTLKRAPEEQRRGDAWERKKEKQPKPPSKKLCWDCGAPGEIVGHPGCKAPGAKKFGSSKEKPSEKKPTADKKPTDKPKDKKQAKATSDEGAATPIVRISLALENGSVLVGVLDSGATDHYIATAEAVRLGLSLEPCAPVQVGSAEAGGGFVVTAKAATQVFIGTTRVALTLSVSDGLAETLLSFRALLQACPGTSWSSARDGAECLIINGVRFIQETTSGAWVPTALTSEEFSARATRLSGPEAIADPASERSRYTPSLWLEAVDASPRPFTWKEETALSMPEPGTKAERKERLQNIWYSYLTLGREIDSTTGQPLWELAGRCAMAASPAAARREMRNFDVETRYAWPMAMATIEVVRRATEPKRMLEDASALAAATARVMMRTLEPDTAALARITEEMHKAGAPTEAVQYFTDQVFWPSERRRLEALERPVAPRGGDLDFDIVLEPNARFFHQRPRHYQPTEAALILQYAEQQVAIGRGRFGTASEADCISNWTLVPRADSTLRPCGAYVRMNGITVLDRTFVPSVQDAIDRIDPSHNIYFTADVEAAFNSVYATESAQRKLALWMPDGRVFFPTVMPYGVKNAPPTFARNISVALQLVQSVFAYFDDTHGGGTDWMAMLVKLKETAEALQEHGFSLSFRKTHLGPNVPLLGFRRTKEGLSADPARLEEIRNLPSPQSKTELRSQIGMLRWVTPFIMGDDEYHGLAEAIGSFDSMTSKTSPFGWTTETETKWRAVLAMLANAVALSRPDFTRDFYLDTDASKIGWGYILYQIRDDGAPVILRIGSKAFKGAMADAAPVHQEAHAVVNAVVDCEDWIAYGHTVLHSDHRPLLWLLHNVELSPRLWGGKALRWTLLLQNFSWTIEHIAGTTNVVADVLSRAQWPDSLQVRRQTDPQARALATRKVPRKMPVIQRRLQNEDTVHADVEDDLVDDNTVQQESVPVVPRPPVGLDEDVFEQVAVAILSGGNIPARFDSPLFSDTIELVRKHVDNLEVRVDRLWHKTDGVYVRQEERDRVLFEAHSAPTGGHFGFAKTMAKLSGRAWWPSIRYDVAAYLALCGICQRCKTQPRILADVVPLPVCRCSSAYIWI